MRVPGIRPAGERGALVELEDNAAVHALAAALEPMRGPTLEEIVPGDRTLLLVWTDEAPPEAAIERMLEEAEDPCAGPVGDPVELAVAYDGEERVGDAPALGRDHRCGHGVEARPSTLRRSQSARRRRPHPGVRRAR